MPAANGSVQLAKLAATLKVVAARDLRLQMMRGLREGAKPLIPLVHEAADRQLPKAGGLNKRVAAQKVSVSVRTGARTAGVRLTTKDLDTKETDSGYVRHPVFNRRYKKGPNAGKRVWAKKNQPLPAAAGWWSKTLAESAPAVQPAMAKVLYDVAVELQGRA
jgi:hypothetical protein